jgi:hypothetical protein
MAESATKQVERLATAIREMQDQGMKVNKNRLSKYMNEEKGDNISIVTVGKYFDGAMARCHLADVKEDNQEVDQELLATVRKVLDCLGIKDSSSAAKDVRNVLEEFGPTLPLTLVIWERDFERGTVRRNSHVRSFKELVGKLTELLRENEEIDIQRSGFEALPYDDTPEFWYFALQNDIFIDWWSNCEEEGKDPLQHIEKLFQIAREQHEQTDWMEDAYESYRGEPLSYLVPGCNTFDELMTRLRFHQEFGDRPENDLEEYPPYPDTPEYWQEVMYRILDDYSSDFGNSDYLEVASNHYDPDNYEKFDDTGAPWKVNPELRSVRTRIKG